jgi:hypothetical protein
LQTPLDAVTTASTCSSETGRLRQAISIPKTTFCRSKASRRPSFFTTIGRISSTRS